MDAATTDPRVVSAQMRGETIAYAVQSGVFNLAANFFEPYVNYRTQKYFSQKGGSNTGAYGSYLQNLGGEFAGDLIGCGTLIASEAFFPAQLHYVMRQARQFVDPIYTAAANVVFCAEKSDPKIEQKMDAWKLFQERNLARSTIMGIGSIAGNISIQKWALGNPSPASVIFKGKLLSTAITTAIGLTSRMLFPKPMQRMDKVMGKAISPMLSDVERLDTPEPSR